MKSTDGVHEHLEHPVPDAALALIREALENIIQSTPFRTSRQCQDLLRYIVHHSMTGEDESLRERIIGVEVFGRKSDYDTGEDPVVRIRAADVRRRLAQHYQAIKSAGARLLIDIPPGSYKAHFHFAESEVPAAIPAGVTVDLDLHTLPPTRPPDLLEESTVHPKPVALRRRWLAAVLSVACLAGLLALWVWSSTRTTAFDVFWAPVLDNSKPVLICAGTNAVYMLSGNFIANYRRTHHLEGAANKGLEFFVPFTDGQEPVASDFLPVKDTYLTVGDAAAITQIVSLLTNHHRTFDFRYGSDLSFGDLRQSPAILIGAFNNSWTLQMTDNLRFVFDLGDGMIRIKDQSSAGRYWSAVAAPDGHLVEDYAIVSRILNSNVGSTLVTVAGLNHYGTRAAADFATNPQQIADLLKKAPADWRKKNIQVVLHTTIVNDMPNPATVVAAYYW